MLNHAMKEDWKETKIKIKKKWDKFTEEDMSSVKKNFDDIYGLLKKYYGITKEEAKTQVNKIINKTKE